LVINWTQKTGVGNYIVDNTLEPIHTLLPPAPEKLLNTIFCNCKNGCNAKCGCKKVGFFYSLACTSCQGQSCSNVESPLGEDAYDIYEETSDSSLLEQFTCIQQEDEEEEEDQEDSTLEVPSDNYQSDE
jgi:transcription elongation factor Elf1